MKELILRELWDNAQRGAQGYGGSAVTNRAPRAAKTTAVGCYSPNFPALFSRNRLPSRI
jgi:hypothetical protein